MKFSTVIFDWDGTLGMTLHLWLEGYRSELKKLGFNLSDEIIVKDFFYEHNKAAIKYSDINFKTFVPNVHKYINSHVSSIKTYKGARNALGNLKSKNIKLMLFSSTPRKLLEEELAHTDLASFFSVIVAGDEILEHKPDPEGFNKIVEIGKLDPKHVIILGDSHNDIVAAKAAGISSCLFLPPENEIFYDFAKLKETSPTYCAETLKDFTSIVINTI